jgi:peptidoglycan hydrolase CwlO-like protein
MKKLFAITGFVLIFTIGSIGVFAQSCGTKDECQNLINQYSQKLSSIRDQKNTLSSQINLMDTQINLTTVKIQDTQYTIKKTGEEIESLSGKIDNLNTSLDYLSKVFLKKVSDGYKRREAPIVDIFIDSENATELTNRLKYMQVAQDSDRKIAFKVEQAKANYEDQKNLREVKKAQLDELTKVLAQQQISLEQQKSQKERLLAQTGNDEATYQRLLSQAQDQLNGFGRFVSSQGGAGLLSNQTVCDDWGCYYSQRDSQWGGNSLNGTGYTLADSGCLITSVAMIYTHYGHRNVNPQTINSNPNNFASYYPAYLLFSVVADGVSSSRVTAAIDGELSSGTPVIVGISYDGGPSPDHFLVLISGSGGNYTMNDPFTANGHAIPFSSRYSTGSIRTVQKVVM